MFLKKLINYLKLIVLAIFNFLASIFRTPLSSSNKKQINKNYKETKQDNKTNSSIHETSLPDTNKSNNEFTVNIDFQKLFIEVIEDITNTKYKNIDNNTKKNFKKIEKEILPKIKDKKILEKNEIKNEIKEEIIKRLTKNKKIEKNENIAKTPKVTEIIKKENITVDKKESHIVINEEPKKQQSITTTTNEKKETICLNENKKIDDNSNTITKPAQPPVNDKDKVVDIKEVKVEYIKPRENIVSEQQTKKSSIIEQNKDPEVKENSIITKDKQPKQDLTKYIDKLNKMTKEISIKINKTLKEKELTEEEYEKLFILIKDGITKIDEFIILNKLSTSEITKLKNNIKELENNKVKIENDKTTEIDKHNKELEEKITDEEKNKINELLFEMTKDYKNDLLELNLNSIEDLNNKTADEIKIIEKRLLMIKLNKALKCAEVPSILALPFIRNRYFAFFTAGLFIHNHLTDISLFNRRKNKDYSPINMEHIINGSNALENSLSLIENNLNELENIKNEYLIKYPELIDNEEFINTFNRLENKLISNYNTLIIKKNRFNKTKNKANKINKKLNNKVLIKTKKV